jgi:hypothetical protein
VRRAPVESIRTQEVEDGRGRGEEVLEVVEDEQGLARAEVGPQGVRYGIGAALPDAGGGGDGGDDLARIGDGGQLDEEDAVGEALPGGVGDRHGQPGLADAAQPGHGDEADAGAGEGGEDEIEVAFAADDRGEDGRDR